jgi:hypothetical protein
MSRVRHSFVSLLSRLGPPIEDIVHLVGHANTVRWKRCRVEQLGLSRRGRTAIGWLDRVQYWPKWPIE